MDDFRRRPPPPPPSTFVVHGAGDVVIQDEHGNHIRTYVSSPFSMIFTLSTNPPIAFQVEAQRPDVGNHNTIM
jgi:hypothetical protein